MKLVRDRQTSTYPKKRRLPLNTLLAFNEKNMSSSVENKYGLIVILDALGASSFSDAKIQEFLSARTRLIELINKQASSAFSGDLEVPSTFTFGDTIVIAFNLKTEENIGTNIKWIIFMLQNYLFQSMEEGILFRGAFSIGKYFEDAKSNTVMGEAVSDAASWYEKADWMGLVCTPKTNTTLDYYLFEEGILDNPLFIQYYLVPLKDNNFYELYTISWAGRLFQDKDKIKDPRKSLLKLLLNQDVPIGTESKMKNIKDYFNFVEKQIQDGTKAKNV